jgi:hypothetical protein
VSARDLLEPLVEWVEASSTSYKAPLGKDTVIRGPWCILIPQALNQPPSPSTFDPAHLPLYLPEQQAFAGMSPWNVAPPQNQQAAAARLRHLIWMLMDLRFHGALLGLSDTQSTLQSVLDAQAPGLDLGELPVLFLPLWILDAEGRAWAESKLPLIRA